jgi:hypothetical protein
VTFGPPVSAPRVTARRRLTQSQAGSDVPNPSPVVGNHANVSPDRGEGEEAMRTILVPMIAAFVLACATTARAQDSVLQPTKEQLTPGEEKAVRLAIYGKGPIFATPMEGRWADYRILVVPKNVKAAYAKKPKATVRLLLKIVEWASPFDALHANGCIGALVHSPPYGRLSATFPVEKLDDLLSDGTETFRERLRRGSVSLIVEKEKSKK